MLRMVPIVLRPKILALKNRWLRRTASTNQNLRDIFLVSLSALLLFFFTNGAYHTCRILKEAVDIRPIMLAPFLELGLIFLFVLLFFANCTYALTSLYLSQDLDIYLASPISARKYFTGKFIDVAAHSSWMTAICSFPVVLGMHFGFQASIFSLFLSLILLAPFFLLPTAMAILGMTLLARYISAHTPKLVIPVILVLFLGPAVYLVQVLAPNSAHKDISELIITTIKLPILNSSWMPLRWIVEPICYGLEDDYSTILMPVFGIWLLLALFIFMAFKFFKKFHFEGITRTRSHNVSPLLQNISRTSNNPLKLPIFDSQWRAIAGKELKFFTRDLSHALQIAILLGISLLYLYNFQMLSNSKQLNALDHPIWTALLYVSNIGMGAFVITALCTRFVFPTISLEGQSFWILKAGPLSNSRILSAKFTAWMIPTALIAIVLFCSGCFAIQAPTLYVWMALVIGLAMSLGIVSLSIGMGAVFANFSWEHSSQIATGVGSLFFMCVSIILILINLIPVTYFVALDIAPLIGFNIDNIDFIFGTTCTILLVGYGNILVKRWALKFAQQAMTKI